jgi:hypothetical protein
VENEIAWEDQDLLMGGYVGENSNKSESGEERVGGGGVLLSACSVHLMKTFLIFSLTAQLLDIYGLFFNAPSILLFSLGTVVTWEDG